MASEPFFAPSALFGGLSRLDSKWYPFIMLHISGSKDDPTGCFEATRWSVVLAAAQDQNAPEQAQAALAQLCQTYWAPLYGFIRRRGHSMHDAEDLTQAFFAYLIEHRVYTCMDPMKGKFRSFLLVSLKNFLANIHDRERALKRGGAYEFLPLHEEQALSAEALFQSSTLPCHATAEDRFFERQWAETLITTVLNQLATEYKTQGKTALFDELSVFLHRSADPLPSYDQLASSLAIPAATIRSYVTRLRARYRVLLRTELRRTVNTEKEVDAELRELLRVLTTR